MSMSLSKSPSNELLFVGFNQDAGCFACGTLSGFRIYNCDPFKETFQREFPSGGIAHVEMLFRCNILALVGGGPSPRYPANKVMIWDDHQNRCIGELSFRSPVKAVRLRRDRVVVVLEYKIFCYNFTDLKLQDHLETTANPKGLCCLSSSSSSTVLACPGLQKGTIRVELYHLKKTTLIEAHESSLACIALNTEGTRLVTASETGTLLRIFDTSSGANLQEVRRGADKADIYSLAFNSTTQWLACSSDRGTIHVFALKVGNGSSSGSRDDIVISSSSSHASSSSSSTPDATKSNPTSSLSFMRTLLPKYFSSEWSFAQFRAPDVRSIVAFGLEKNSLIVVSADGHYYKALFDPSKGGGQECVTEQSHSFLHSTAPVPVANAS